MKWLRVVCIFWLGTIVACAFFTNADSIPPTPKPTPTAQPTATSEPIGDYVPLISPRCNGSSRWVMHSISSEGVDAVGMRSGSIITVISIRRSSSLLSTQDDDRSLRVGRDQLGRPPCGHTGRLLSHGAPDMAYLWLFLPLGTSTSGSYLVVAEAGTDPLDLPCCK